jgi:hypothetical protein
VEYYDHGMIGATLAVAAGAQRRYGWAAVVLAALAAMFPDWDAATERSYPRAYAEGHRFWGHNLFAETAAGAALGWLGYLIHRSRSRRLARPPSPDEAPVTRAHGPNRSPKSFIAVSSRFSLFDGGRKHSASTPNQSRRSR